MTRSYNATAMPMRNNRGFPTVADGFNGRVRVGRGGAKTLNLCGRIGRPSFLSLIFFYTAVGGGHGPFPPPLDSLLP